jgi:hypothetical protein
MLFIKLNISKAFDSISWVFLLETMRARVWIVMERLDRHLTSYFLFQDPLEWYPRPTYQAC